MPEDKSSAQHTDEVVAPELHTEEAGQTENTNDVQTPSIPSSSDTNPDDLGIDALLDKVEMPANGSEPTTISRRDRAKEKDISRWEGAILDSNGNVNALKLKAEYLKNPRGLEDFAAKNDFDPNELLKATIPAASRTDEDTEALKRRIEMLERDKVESQKRDEKDRFKTVVSTRLAEYGIKVPEFTAKYKASFDQEFVDLVSRGFSYEQAADKALKLTVGQEYRIQQAVKQAEKQAEERNKNALLPKGNVQAAQTTMQKLSRGEYASLPKDQRVVYAQKFGKREGGGQFDPLIPQFKD